MEKLVRVYQPLCFLATAVYGLCILFHYKEDGERGLSLCVLLGSCPCASSRQRERGPVASAAGAGLGLELPWCEGWAGTRATCWLQVPWRMSVLCASSCACHESPEKLVWHLFLLSAHRAAGLEGGCSLQAASRQLSSGPVIYCPHLKVRRYGVISVERSALF